MDREQIEVYPKGESWHYRHRKADGSKSKASVPYADRASCLVDARGEAGIERLTLHHADGSEYGETVKRGLPVVLLRADGSLVGEVESGASTSDGGAQTVSIAPAGESSEAGSVG